MMLWLGHSKGHGRCLLTMYGRKVELAQRYFQDACYMQGTHCLHLLNCMNKVNPGAQCKNMPCDVLYLFSANGQVQAHVMRLFSCPFCLRYSLEGKECFVLVC